MVWGRKRQDVVDAGRTEAVIGGRERVVVRPEVLTPQIAPSAPVPPDKSQVGGVLPPEPPLVGDLKDDEFLSWLKEAARSVGEDYLFVGPDQVASSPEALLRAQELNLLFAIFCEVRRLRELSEVK